jgi:uncharacterized membrane protein
VELEMADDAWSPHLFALVRAIHVLGVILWIGGVAMMTTVLTPILQQFGSNEERISLFEAIESRFARQARVTTLITGLSGFLMLEIINGWSRYGTIQYWWIHGMTLIWAIFTLMLFVLEPLVLHKRFLRRAREDPARTFRIARAMHWVLLTASLVTVAAAVAGSHGWIV